MNITLMLQGNEPGIFSSIISFVPFPTESRNIYSKYVHLIYSLLLLYRNYVHFLVQSQPHST